MSTSLNRKEYFELLNEALDGKYNIGNLNDFEKQIKKTYLVLIARKLEKDLPDVEIRFDERGDLEIRDLALTIKVDDVVSYDDVLAQIESKLSSTSSDEKEKLHIQNKWGYTFSSGYAPYFDGNTNTFHIYDSTYQSSIFVLLKWVIDGVVEKDLGWANEMMKKYTERQDMFKPNFGKGTIDELGGLKFQFSKNGNMKFGIKDSEFYDKIYEWYEICDPKARNHQRRR